MNHRMVMMVVIRIALLPHAKGGRFVGYALLRAATTRVVLRVYAKSGECSEISLPMG